MTLTVSSSRPAVSALELPVELRPGTCTVGVIGGTGGQGRGLAYRFGAAGLSVVIGSRSAERARAAADEVLPAGVGSRGADNRAAATAADIVLLAVPWFAQADVLEQLAPVLAGKIVVNCCNPLGFDEGGAYALRVPAGSAAEAAAHALPESTVVGAFHHVSSTLLLDPTRERMPSLDIMVVSDSVVASKTVQSLVDTIPGLRGIYAGGLRNAHQLEALSATLITISKHHATYTGLTINGV